MGAAGAEGGGVIKRMWTVEKAMRGSVKEYLDALDREGLPYPDAEEGTVLWHAIREHKPERRRYITKPIKRTV
jgi:hypothetical protein